MRGPLRILACESGKPFAIKVFNYLREKSLKEGKEELIQFVNTEEKRFANTELKTVINESIRDTDVYIFQNVNPTKTCSVNDNLRALLTAIDATRRSAANYITAVIPVFPYVRQDKAFGREAITAAMVAKEIEDAGAGTVITLDIHNNAVAGFFRKAVLENLYASKNIIDFIKGNIPMEKLIVASPDEGGVKRASYYAEALRTKFIICYKKRDYTRENFVEKITVLGEDEVPGNDVLILDDIVDTAGTLVNVIKELKEKLANRIYFACSLPLLNGPACERLSKLHQDGLLDLFIGTDVVYHGEDFEKKNSWYKEVSVAKYFASVIYNQNQGRSISSLLK